MSYRIAYEAAVVDDIKSLPSAILKNIRKAIESRLVTNPFQYGKPLRFTLKGHRRLRMGDYRVIYRVHEDTKTVYIVAIGLRRDIYED